MSLQHIKLHEGERILVVPPDGRHIHVTPKNGKACEFAFLVPPGVLVKKLPALAQGLVLERRQGEGVRIGLGDAGELMFALINEGRRYLCIDAPEDVSIDREEVCSKKPTPPAAEPRAQS